MLKGLDAALNFHSQALGVRAQRGEVLASNIANADTPNYQARDLDFGKALQGALDNAQSASAGAAMAASSAGHLPGKALAPANDGQLLFRTPQAPSIDNNTVALDVERAKFADNALHYEANLTFLNGQIRSLLSAIQG